MKHTEHSDKPCPVAQSLGVVGDNWTLLILRNAFQGARRFDDFQQQLGLTRHVLTDRLKKLVEHNILKKVPYGTSQSRFEYRLTPKGTALSPILIALGNWGNEWLFEQDQQPMHYIHKGCGGELQAQVHCVRCEKEVEPKDIKTQMGLPVKQLKQTLPHTEFVQKMGFNPQQ